MKNSESIDAIRQAADIVQIINEVVPLKRRGTNYLGLCPFHNEKSPSFSVSSTKQFFHCFGCKAGGDVFKFLQLFHRWDFTQVLEELSRRTGIKIETYQVDPSWEEGFQILDITKELFKEELHSKAGTEFRDYLTARKIPEKLWEDFHLGAHTGSNRMLADMLKAKKFSLDIAVRLGLLGRSNQGEYYDRFQGRLMFPILDDRGRTRGFGGRGLGSEQPKYLNSPKTAHFDKSRLFYGMHLAHREVPRKGYAVLVEGYLDVIALVEFGVTNALGSMGTALTLDQMRVLKRYSPRVISLYDADKAGVMATEKNLGNFLREGLEAKVVLLPNGKDPDAFLHNEAIALEDRKIQLRVAFQNSISAVDYLVQNTVLNEKNAMTRGQRLRGLVNILDQVPDEIERAVLKKDIAKRFELPERMLMGAQAEPLSTDKFEPKMGVSAAENSRWEREILRFLVKWGEKEAFDLTGLIPYLSSASKWASLLLRLIELRLESRVIGELRWLNDVEADLQAEIREWVLEDKVFEGSFDIRALWVDLQKGLRRSYFQREGDRIQFAIETAEENDDVEKVRKLLSEKQDLLKLYKASSEQLTQV